MTTSSAVRQPLWQPVLFVLLVLTLIWTISLMLLNMKGILTWETDSMSRRIWVLVIPMLLLVGSTYAGYNVWAAQRASVTTETTPLPEAVATTQSDRRFTLEVRRFGVTVDRFRQRAMLIRLDEAGLQGELLLQNASDYPWSSSERDSASSQRENNVFGYTLRNWTTYWPIPVIVAGPPRNAGNSNADRMSTHINSADNGAGIGNTLYVRLDELQTEHGEEAMDRLFDFFERHPDLPAAVVLVEDGLNTRAYMRTPGDDYVAQSNKNGRFVPKRPDSFVALLVTRKDRVDRLIRPYVTEVPEAIDNTRTGYDVIKLWNYFWGLQKAYWENGKNEMPWDYWQAQLPEFWKTTQIKVPEGFKPNPWVPIPWTSWQLRDYDNSPVLAYLHRPVQIDLSDGHGQPLKKGERIEHLRAGWQQALETLSSGDQPSRMFYDTGASPSNLALLVQSLHDNAQHIDLDDPKDAFDMQRRIGADTGTSSTWVQLALALMMGYGDGKTSALVNLRDPLHASIVMMTPPDAASRKAHPQSFSWDF